MIKNIIENKNEDINGNINEDIKFDIGIFDPTGLKKNPLNQQSYSTQFKNLAKFWSNLPAYSMGQKIVESIISNDILLIKSGTGSGKTVTVPPFALHANNYKGKIIVTLPKKIITKKAAEFAAKILDVKLGEEIGYQFRGENLRSNKTKLLYSTDGSIISMIKSDPMLKSIDIIIIDEAHERKVNIDLLLYLIKNAIEMRNENKFKPLKLIIMSATINETIFESYFSKFKFEWLELMGTPNYPIESIYLEVPLDLKSNEYLKKGKEIIDKIITKINLKDKKSQYIDGDILFFVCSVSECDMLAEELGKKYQDCFTMGLYSNFNSELEKYISNPEKFKELNPKFKRRLFISTNVAESSLTIDGIVYVIDSGLEINVSFKPETNINFMEKKFITQAQIIQRKGRAGRTKPGICFHLYTPKIQESCNKFPIPEIRSIDLKNTCLSLMKLCSDINNYYLIHKDNKDNNSNKETETDTSLQNEYKLKKSSNDLKTYCTMLNTITMFTHLIEPPGEKFIENGFDFAISQGLIAPDNTLSKIGRLIVESRLDVMDGLSLIYAYSISLSLFQDVFKIISICSFLKTGIYDLFYDKNDFNVKKIINKLVKISKDSEHLFLHHLYKYIETNTEKGIFNFELIKSINNAYSRQIDKIESLYKKFNIKLNNLNKNNLETNIIKSLGYGYKYNSIFKSAHGYKFNDKLVDLSKCIIQPQKNCSTLFFYTNLSWSEKLYVMICSPYLLK